MSACASDERGSRRKPGHAIAARDWYADGLGQSFVPLAEAAGDVAPRPLRRLVARPGMLQGVAIGIRARRGGGAALLADPERRRRMRDEARRQAASWRYEDYFNALRAAVEARLGTDGR